MSEIWFKGNSLYADYSVKFLAVNQSIIYNILQQEAPLVLAKEKKLGKGLSIENSKITFSNSKDDFREKRSQIKFGRYARRVLGFSPTDISDSELNSIATKITREISEKRIELVDGIKIAEAYHEKFGNSSCMTSSSISTIESRLAIYIKNPDKIKLIKYYNGSARLRAIAWFGSDGRVLIDRHYTNNNDIISTFRKDISEYIANLKPIGLLPNRVIFRRHNNLPNGTNLDESFSIKLDSENVYSMPYLDTLRNRKKLDKSAVVLSTKATTKQKLEKCPECNYVRKLYKVSSKTGIKYVCTYCKSNKYSKCNICNKYHLDTRPIYDRRSYYGRVNFTCSACQKDFTTCNQCNNKIHVSKTFFGTCYECSDIKSTNQTFQNNHQFIS